MSEEIVRTESIANDKDGTLEKVFFKPRAVVEDGKTKISEPWELRATGKKVNELKGAFKDVAPSMLHEGMKSWEDGGGDLKVSRPDGSVDTIRADMEEKYRQMPGFCQSAVRPTFTLDVPWEGSAKREGIRRQIIKKDYTETWYTDGRYVLEER